MVLMVSVIAPKFSLKSYDKLYLFMQHNLIFVPDLVFCINWVWFSVVCSV